MGAAPGAETAFLAPLQERIALRFGNAYTSSPNQFVALGTILTGRYPSAIPMCGLTHKGAEAETDRPWCSRVAEGVATIPEVLALYGYDTALFRVAVPGADVLESHFTESFDLTARTEHGITPWPELGASLRGWWDAHAEAPRLAVVVVSDLMYTERDDLVAQLGLEGWTGETAEGRQQCASLHELARSQYEDDAAVLGRGLSGLLRGLDEAPSSRPRLTLVSSTNGMSLGEIGGRVSQRDFFFSNSMTLERTNHVPLALLVRDPEDRLSLLQASTLPVQQRVVELVDLLPTLLELGGAVLPAGIPGRSLLGEGEPEPFAYSELGDMIAVRSGRYTLTFRAPQHNISALDPSLNEKLTRVGFRRLLFLHDVVADPMQVEFLGPRPGVHNPRLTELHRLLVSVRTGIAAPPPEAMTAERLKEIRLTASEGYW